MIAASKNLALPIFFFSMLTCVYGIRAQGAPMNDRDRSDVAPSKAVPQPPDAKRSEPRVPSALHRFIASVQEMLVPPKP